MVSQVSAGGASERSTGAIDVAATLLGSHRAHGTLDVHGLAAEIHARAEKDPDDAAALTTSLQARMSPVERGQFQAALAESDPASQEGVGAFFDGAIRGDFSGNNSWSKLGGQTAMGFVPVAGQIADARDMAAAVGQIWRGEEGGWLNLGAAVVGWVPGVGDAAKGLIRGGEHAASAGERALAKSAKGGAETGASADKLAARTERETASEAKAGEKAALKVRKFDDAESFNAAANHAAPSTRYEYGRYAYETDDLGRVKVSEGQIDLTPAGRNDAALQAAIGREGKPTDVGFHLIADRFGGQTNRLNVVPGNGRAIGDGLPNLNQGPYKHFENTVGKLAANPKNKVEVRIEAQYDAANKTSRPDGFEASYRVNGGLWATQTFVNK